MSETLTKTEDDDIPQTMAQQDQALINASLDSLEWLRIFQEGDAVARMAKPGAAQATIEEMRQRLGRTIVALEIATDGMEWRDWKEVGYGE